MASTTRAHRTPASAAAPRHPGGAGPGQGPQPAGLAPVVLGHQVGGDAVQPGPGRVPAPVERGPPLEGDPEYLAQQVLGLGRVDAAGQEPEQRRPVPVEDDPERPWFSQRSGDHRPVRLLRHTWLFPVTGPGFTGTFLPRRGNNSQRPQQDGATACGCCESWPTSRWPTSTPPRASTPTTSA